MTKTYDAIIIGGGPAGLASALALARVHRTAVVFSNNKFRNAGIHASHTVLSRDHVPPEEIRDIGRADIAKYGNTEFVETTITKLTKSTKKDDNDFNAFTAENETGQTWHARTVVLAMGSKDKLPENIPGYADNWPLNIYQCLFCDGHERTNLAKGVLVSPFSPLYLTMASMAHFQSMPPGANHLPVEGQKSAVTIFTNGPPANRAAEPVKKLYAAAQALGMRIEERRITKLVSAAGGEPGLTVVLEDGEEIYMGFLFHKPQAVPNDVTTGLVAQLGVETVTTPLGTDIKRNEPMGATNVQGVYVAGDAGTHVKQVSTALFTGFTAGAGIAQELAMQDAQIAVVHWKKVGAL